MCEVHNLAGTKGQQPAAAADAKEGGGGGEGTVEAIFAVRAASPSIRHGTDGTSEILVRPLLSGSGGTGHKAIFQIVRLSEHSTQLRRSHGSKQKAGSQSEN